MRYALVALSLVVFAAYAGGEFSTGGAELLKFKGYAISYFDIWGEEDADPDMSFDVIASVSWLPKLNEWLDAKIAFKAKPTRVAMSDLSLTTEDIVLNLHPVENFTFSMGQFKRPFGYNYTRSGSSMYFRDRALLTGQDEFKNFGGRDIGANFNLSFEMVDIDLAYTNSSGDNVPENDSNKQFTARAEIEVTPGITIAGAFGSHTIDDPDTTETDQTLSATGMDFYGVVEYPLSETATLNFVGEYLMLGETVDEDLDATDANAMAFTLAPHFDLAGEELTAIQPAIRYENYSPYYTGETDPENDVGAIDFCVSLFLFSDMNTLQIGGRNYTYEAEGMDGYTDMYIDWRMKF
ncbi:hypothetical protein GF402_00470 [Candidatus Fermentibacteria bacterium]|nr:hypothetical protein [Candidatus Fermentibacteria bacterium]